LYTIDGTTRNAASGYATYCEISGLDVSDNIFIKFAVQDIDGNVMTGATGTRYHDITGPETISDIYPTSEAFATGIISFLRSGTTDTGIGLSGYFIQIST